MRHLLRLLSVVWSILAYSAAFAGDLCVDVLRWDITPQLDALDSLHADRALRFTRVEATDGLSIAGPMFTERARDHDRFIGDGFTNLGGGAALPI